MAHALKDTPKGGVKIVDEKQKTSSDVSPASGGDAILLKPNFKSIIVRPF